VHFVFVLLGIGHWLLDGWMLLSSVTQLNCVMPQIHYTRFPVTSP